MSTSDLSGSWTYRSFNPEYVTGNQTPHQLIVADDVVLTLRTAPDPTGLAGEIEWQGGGLDLNGTVVISGDESFDLVGIGRPGTATDGWEYRYHGHLTRNWPNAVNQRPAPVGNVIRVKPHEEAAPAGYVAPFIAVKQ